MLGEKQVNLYVGYDKSIRINYIIGQCYFGGSVKEVTFIVYMSL